MKKSVIATVAVGLLVFASCGSDSGGSAGGAQGEAADAAIAAAAAEGMELDEGCVNDLSSQLSDADAAAIVEAGPDGDAELSAEGTAIGAQLLNCADKGAIIDMFIAQMKTSGQEFDEDCVRDGLQDVDFASLAAAEGSDTEAPTELIDAVMSCITLAS